jgi:hypothetical protein
MGTRHEPPSKQAQAEEVNDEEAGGCCRWIQEFNGAAEELGEGKTLFEEIRESQEAMCEPPMAPFVDEGEWELARWLMKNVTQMATDEFLKMKGVCHSPTQISIFLPTHWSDPYSVPPKLQKQLYIPKES